MLVGFLSWAVEVLSWAVEVVKGSTLISLNILQSGLSRGVPFSGVHGKDG